MAHATRVFVDTPSGQVVVARRQAPLCFRTIRRVRSWCAREEQQQATNDGKTVHEMIICGDWKQK
jgi:MFS superfamily sulfate permease-like transporter